jgi:hypothetical protein
VRQKMTLAELALVPLRRLGTTATIPTIVT